VNLKIRKFHIFKSIWAGAVLSLSLAGWLVPDGLSARPMVILDAAHGGNDSGIKSGSEVEKQWNLKVVQALETALNGMGFDVMLVRKGDETILEDKRVQIINTSQASAAIIVHADREWTGTQTGPILVVEPPNHPEGGFQEITQWGIITPGQYRSNLKLARDIIQRLGISPEFSYLSDSRGLAAENTSPVGRIFCLPHQSLRNLTLPAVVLTPLFLTSSGDLKKFSQAETLKDFADRVSQGVADFLGVPP
jgi:N-acetylmuramoyl-L-alanine amidase